MIISRQQFKLKDYIVFEKVIINTPFKYEGVFDNGGCFIHIKGEGTRLISADENKVIDHEESALLKCGTYYFDLHKKNENNQIEMIAIHLFPELIQDVNLTQLPKKQESTTLNSNDIITQFIQSLEFYFDYPELMSDEILTLKLKELIILLIQTEQIESISSLLADLTNPQSFEFNKVIEAHLFSNLSIEELANLTNLSLSSFKREFKKNYSDSPTNYILSKRLEKAKELLVYSENNISEIAYDLGFNDPLYFTRLFKKKEGVPPTEYRAANLS